MCFKCCRAQRIKKLRAGTRLLGLTKAAAPPVAEPEAPAAKMSFAEHMAQKKAAEEAVAEVARAARLAAAKTWDEEEVMGIKISNLITSCGVREQGGDYYVQALKAMTAKIGGGGGEDGTGPVDDMSRDRYCS